MTLALIVTTFVATLAIVKYLPGVRCINMRWENMTFALFVQLKRLVEYWYQQYLESWKGHVCYWNQKSLNHLSQGSFIHFLFLMSRHEAGWLVCSTSHIAYFPTSTSPIQYPLFRCILFRKGFFHAALSSSKHQKPSFHVHMLPFKT